MLPIASSRVGRTLAASIVTASPSAMAVLILYFSGAFGSFLDALTCSSTVFESSLTLAPPQHNSVGPVHTSTAMPISSKIRLP